MTSRPVQRARLTRRALALGLGACAIAVPVSGLAQDQPSGALVLVVSRSRVLNETKAAQILRQTELEYSGQLQREIDALKESFDAEEQELAALRANMDRAAFELRIADFDRRVRAVRRLAQERAADLQRAFQEARLELVNALTPLLEEVRQSRGALVLLNADDTLSYDPATDITEDVIIAFDEAVPVPEIPEFEPFAVPERLE